MSLPHDTPLQKLQFYATTAYRCGYLQHQLAQSLIATPQHLVNAEIYSSLIQQGFRRSGKFAYRPHCESCRACIPVRIVTNEFHCNRSQKRAFRQHKTLTTSIIPVGFYEAHYALYAAYQKSRHEEPPDDAQPKTQVNEIEQYQSFLCQTNVESVMVEFRENGALKMVSVIDIVQDGISAVYTFYDTSNKKASYGTYNVLWQIEWAKSLGLPYVYLGYWIKDSKKMAYKQNFQPQEQLVDHDWVK
ncbi:MAG: arginyltransferase [Betaproteobacteria bacterium HGW-Betaproteobacteria-22]|nr:MAG: arginyltransferase [Betaproteobacteria bacterium HGW-Betaproteobacteria-22]